MAPRRLAPIRLLAWPLLLVGLALTSAACGTEKSAQKGVTVTPGQTRLRVASFEIKGTKRFDADTIKDGLATAEDPGWRAAISWMPLLGAEHQYFNRIDWRRDLERITTFYKMHGYFNARVVSRSIVESRKNKAVRISIRIAEGKPTHVSTRNIEGLEPLSDKNRKEILANLPLKQGDVFTQDAYLKTRKMLVDRLHKHSYAYAEISGRAIVNPQTNKAEVYYFLDPGPKARFGQIHIVGNKQIETHFIREALSIEKGQAYSGTALEEAQQDLYDMGVFSLVSVLPAHEASPEIREAAGVTQEELGGSDFTNQGTGEQAAPGQPAPADKGPQPVEQPDKELNPQLQQEVQQVEQKPAEVPGPLGISDVLASAQQQAESRTQLEKRVPIIVRIKEGRLWNVELGAGLSLETNRSDVHGQANWSSQNFLGGLRKLEHFNTAGYAWASNSGDVSLGSPLFFGTETDAANQGVFLESRLEFRQPQFLERKTTFKLTTSLNRDIEVGYTVWNPQGTIGLERPFWRHLTLGVNYHVAYYAYSNVGAALLTSPELGIDFQQNYLLEWLEQTLALDLRDNPLNPQSGFFSTLSIQEAGSYLVGGDFDFLKVIWGNEGYVPFDLFTRWVLAARFRVGAIYNTEPARTNSTGEVQTRAVPIENRLYGGGPNSLRGLGRRNLSYFRIAPFDPTDPNDVQTVEVIPVGGLSLFEASIEPRFQLVSNLADVGPLWGVLFYDVATVLDQQLLFSTQAGQSLEQGTAGFSDITGSLVSGVGGGAFWLTPVGPVRADFALTLNDLSNDPRFRTCGPPSRVTDEVTQTGRTDCEYLPVGEDPVQQQLNLNYSFFIGIGHSF